MDKNNLIASFQDTTNTAIEDVKDMVVSGEVFSDTTRKNNADSYGKQMRFLSWQRKNPFFKKQISILGDSISTLDGYNPEGYNLFLLVIIAPKQVFEK